MKDTEPADTEPRNGGTRDELARGALVSGHARTRVHVRPTTHTVSIRLGTGGGGALALDTHVYAPTRVHMCARCTLDVQ